MSHSAVVSYLYRSPDSAKQEHHEINRQAPAKLPISVTNASQTHEPSTGRPNSINHGIANGQNGYFLDRVATEFPNSDQHPSPTRLHQAS
jgi:hypothetical protein